VGLGYVINFCKFDKFLFMNEALLLKKQTKKYIDTADDKVVKMVHAMLQANAETDWWDEIGEDEKASIERGLKNGAEGKTKTHKEVMKKYKKWL
jgi:23S rRNA maturation mini-RNase III